MIAVGKAKMAAQFHKPTVVLEDAANVSDGSSRTALLSARKAKGIVIQYPERHT